MCQLSLRKGGSHLEFLEYVFLGVSFSFMREVIVEDYLMNKIW